MDRIKKNFGFGCMRLPMSGDEVDKVQMCQMVDAFLEAGFNYFDTAHGYLQGKSETALRDCLTSRYPRDRYVLTDKLTGSYFKTEADIRPFFQRQLEACGVEYFDFYLMHSQHAGNFGHFRECRAYETAFALKAEGKVRHVGISFHDRAEVLEEILTTYPQIEVVQIQFNYADYDDPGVQSRLCYEVCRRHNKPVLVMEPVKGGHLSNLPPQAKAVLDECRTELRAEGKKFDEKLEVGTMIETPAAVFIADELAEECDFFSIGTNDLTQYTCALDRQNAKLEPFSNPHHPAVLRAIKMTIDAGHRHGIWVGICGELGADTALTETFLRMGVDELSMNAKSVLPVRKIIRSIDLSKPSDK